MNKLSFLMILAASGLILQACSSLTNTAGGNSAGNDSTMYQNSIIGRSATPGSTITGTYKFDSASPDVTANSTGPSPVPGDEANFNDTKGVKGNSGNVYSQRFIKLAAFNRITEIKLSQLGASRTKNQAIRNFCNQLQTDYAQIGAGLNELARSKKLTVPGLDQQASDELNGKLDKLSDLSDERFNDAFIKRLVKDHKDTIEIFDQGAHSDDEAIRAYAGKYLGGLKTQLKALASLR